MKDKIIVPIILIILIGALIMLYTIKNKNEEGYDFKVFFFNAGKADAIILEKNGKYMMIDTGEESLSDDILNYFKENNIDRLEYLIITHFDKDHVGSASEIINNIEIGEVIQSNYPKESIYYTNYLNSLNSKSITPKTISGNYEITLEDLKITINGPDKIYDSNESNNSSLIISVKYNNNNFLFAGDAQNARLKDFIATNNEEYDFLKVPYHGHYLKRLEELIENRNIKYAVITSSNKEMEDEETKEVLENNNIKYYLTRDGRITTLSNGEDIIIKQ